MIKEIKTAMSEGFTSPPGAENFNTPEPTDIGTERQTRPQGRVNRMNRIHHGEQPVIQFMTREQRSRMVRDVRETAGDLRQQAAEITPRQESEAPMMSWEEALKIAQASSGEGQPTPIKQTVTTPPISDISEERQAQLQRIAEQGMAMMGRGNEQIGIPQPQMPNGRTESRNDQQQADLRRMIDNNPAISAGDAAQRALRHHSNRNELTAAGAKNAQAQGAEGINQIVKGVVNRHNASSPPEDQVTVRAARPEDQRSQSNHSFDFDQVIKNGGVGEYKVQGQRKVNGVRYIDLINPETQETFTLNDSMNKEMVASLAEEVPDHLTIDDFEEYIDQQIRDTEDRGPSLDAGSVAAKLRTLEAYTLEGVVNEFQERQRKQEAIDEYKSRLFLAVAENMANTGNKDQFIAVMAQYIGKSGMDRLMFRLESKEPERFQINESVKLFECAKIVGGAVVFDPTEKSGYYYRAHTQAEKDAIEAAVKARLSSRLEQERDETIAWSTTLTTTPRGIAALAAVVAGTATPEQQRLVVEANDRAEALNAVTTGVARTVGGVTIPLAQDTELVNQWTKRATNAAKALNPDELKYRTDSSMKIGQRLLVATGMATFYGGATDESGELLIKQEAVKQAIAEGVEGFTPEGGVNMNQQRFWQIVAEKRQELGVRPIRPQVRGAEEQAHNTQGVFASVFNVPESISEGISEPFARGLLYQMDSRVENFAYFMGYASLTDMMSEEIPFTMTGTGRSAGGLNNNGRMSSKMGQGTTPSWASSLKKPDEYIGAAAQFLKSPLANPDSIANNVDDKAVLEVLKPMIELSGKAHYMQNMYPPQTEEDFHNRMEAHEFFTEDIFEATLLYHNSLEAKRTFKWKAWNSNVLSAMVRMAARPEAHQLLRSSEVWKKFGAVGGSLLNSIFWNMWFEAREGLNEGFKKSRQLALRVAIEAAAESLAS